MNTQLIVSRLTFLMSLLFAAPVLANFSAATFQGKSSGCGSGAFLDLRNGGECWACPTGYDRTVGYAVDTNQACVDRPTFKAAFERKHGCQGGTFFDPRNGGECWECPDSFPRRTAYAVTDDKACATKNVIGEKLRSATYKYKSGCTGSAFFDPRNGGECWACPSGFNRTATAVTDDKACAKSTEVFASASFKSKFSCPSGAFFDPRNGGECWSCPSGQYRSINPVTSNKACTNKPLEIFAADGQAICKQVIDGIKEGKQGAEKLSKSFEALIVPVKKPLDDAMAKLSGQMKTPAELDKLYGNLSKHLSSELTSELIRIQRNLKNAAGKLDQVLLDSNLMCGGNFAEIDRRLIALDLNPKLGPSKSSAWDDFFIKSARAYSGQGVYSTYAIAVAIPDSSGFAYNVGFTLVTNFNGAGGIYFGIGPQVSTSTGLSANVGAMVYPVASLSTFDSSPVPGAQISFGAGDKVKDFFKKAGRAAALIPDSIDIAFDPTFQSVPGFGVSKGIGGEGNPFLDLTGVTVWSFPLTVWGR
jgi:hypothetical protein